MPWEQRGKNRYYYRRQYKDGKEIRVYFGRGPEAERAAAEDAAKEAIYKLERAERKQFIRESKINRAVIKAAITMHRAQYDSPSIHLDRDGNLRRKNARTLRREAQSGTS